MRNFIAPAALAFSLVIGSAAFAATPAPASAPAKPAATATKTSMATKRAACEKSWKSQKTHTGDAASFVTGGAASG